MCKITQSLAVLVSLFSLFACSHSAPAGEFIVKGKIQNIPDSTQIQFYVLNGNLYQIIGMDTIINGEFSFQDTISNGTRLLHLSLGQTVETSPFREICVAPTEVVTITGDGHIPLLWSVESDIEEQKEADLFMLSQREELLLAARIDAERLALMFSKPSKPLTEQQKKEAKATQDSLFNLLMATYGSATAKKLEFMETAPVTKMWLDQFLSSVAVMQYDKESKVIPTLKKLFTKLSDQDKLTPQGELIVGYMSLPEQLEVGDAMVDGVLFDTLGVQRSLSELKGKYILLDFWSAGCGPCIQSLPELGRVEHQYAEKLNVVSISEDSKDFWKTFIAKRKLTGNQWNELRGARTGLAASYGVQGVPHYVLIDPDGKIVLKWSGYGNGIIESQLKPFLK